MPEIIQHVPAGQVCCNPAWEDAYRRFETEQEEVEKFLRRLRRFGFHQADKNLRVVELFCGRGGGLVALETLGFKALVGVDLSLSLLQQYNGPAELHLADCRKLPFELDSFDVAIVQGGLHHLPDLLENLDEVLGEVSRILKPSGEFYVVEPWQTPFLRFVHAVVEQPWVRSVYKKGDALAEMTEHERETYEQWLEAPNEILTVFEKHFQTIYNRQAWGKLNYVGHPTAVGNS